VWETFSHTLFDTFFSSFDNFFFFLYFCLLRNVTFALWSAHALVAGLLLSSIEMSMFSSFFVCTTYHLLCCHKPIKNYAVLMVKIKLNKMIMDLVKNTFQPLLLLLRFAKQQVLHMSRNGSRFSELSHTSLSHLLFFWCLGMIISVCSEWVVCINKQSFWTGDKVLIDFPFVLWCDPFNLNPKQAVYPFLSLSLGHLSQSAVSGLWLSISRRSVPRQGGQNTPGSASLQLREGGNGLCDCWRFPLSLSYFLDSWSDSLRVLGDI